MIQVSNEIGYYVFVLCTCNDHLCLFLLPRFANGYCIIGSVQSCSTSAALSRPIHVTTAAHHGLFKGKLSILLL